MNLDKEKVKQISLISLGIILIGIGYFCSIKNEEKIDFAKRNGNEVDLGDVELVNTEPIQEFETGNIVSNTELENYNLLVDNSIIVDDANDNKLLINEYNYFEETRIEREKMYSEMI